MKKVYKRILASSFLLAALLFLSGCVQTDKKTGEPTGDGWVYNLLVKPMGSAIEFFANEPGLGLGFGLGIIMVTIVVRLLILPLGLNQAYKSSYFQEKSKFLAPYLQPLQDKLKNAVTQEEKLAAQQALMKAQKENGLDMMSSMGCLPLLIQMPFFSALFYAAKWTPGVSDANFLGMNLGQSSIVLTIIAGVFYFIQSYISMIGVDEAQRGQMKTMLFMSPAMIVFFSLTSPAGVTLYWVVGGLFGIIQQVITTFIIKPRLKKRIDEEFEKNPPVINAGMKDVTPSAAGTVKSANVDPAILAAARKKQNRNAGKQKRK